MIIPHNIIILVILISLILCLCYLQQAPKECYIDPMLEKMRRDLMRIEPRVDNLHFFTGTESYTEDKSRIYICMKDKEGKYYPYNTIIQVGLHEIAHAFSPVIDPHHTSKEFNDLHNYYRTEAEKLGILDPSIPVQGDYCMAPHASED